MASQKDPTRQAIRIYLRHHNDPDGKYKPKQGSCQDWEDRKGHIVKGCGGTTWRYVTYPNEKGMRFDGPPDVVPNSEVNLNGAIVAEVYTDNVHFATCTARKRITPVDGKAAAAGIS